MFGRSQRVLAYYVRRRQRGSYSKSTGYSIQGFMATMSREGIEVRPNLAEDPLLCPKEHRSDLCHARVQEAPIYITAVGRGH